MSHNHYYTIVPFDPIVGPNPQIRLPIDLDDFAHQIQSKWPISETRIHKYIEGIGITFYISHEKYGPWVIAIYGESYSDFEVSVWPEDMAKQIVFWYRQYIPQNYRLFVVVPGVGPVKELPANSTLTDTENILAIVLTRT